MIRALTLRQPWAWAIAHCDKRVENRTWAPPQSLVGWQLAIHAGLTLDRDAVEDFNFELTEEERGGCPLTAADLTRGAIVAVARLDRVARYTEHEVYEAVRRGDRWLCGPVGWHLDRVVAIDPLPCRGAQGLWRPASDDVVELRRRYAAAVRGAS